MSIFYSWQSDSPDATNRRLIRQALRAACTNAETQHAAEGIRLEIDEATRNQAGSPNIPQTILRKIREADFFVCDLTRINSSKSKKVKRPTPNPNVLFELGFAVSILGWQRIVMLHNEAFGSAKDLPFDIDRQRASAYKCTPAEAKKLGKGEPKALFNLVSVALEAMVSANPPKAITSGLLSVEEEQRTRDVFHLKNALSLIHLPTLDRHIEGAPKRIHDNSFYFQDSLSGLIATSLFHIYDKKALKLLTSVSESWSKSLSYGHCYFDRPGGDSWVFPTPGDMPLPFDKQKDWNEIKAAIRELDSSKKELLEYMRNHYIEIDVYACSKEAWRDFKKP